MTRTALVLSPHLDDAAFSCGGVMALLADAGWLVCLVTAFTRSVPDPQGFALACQLDKGLPPGIDYMQVRRDEDRVAAAALGVTDLRWLDVPEAPHRGYDSAPALFGAMREDDQVWRDLVPLFEGLQRELTPEVILVPQGLGDHVDHRQLIHAALESLPGERMAFYRDTPYAIRKPDALRSVTLPAMMETTVPIGAALDRKLAAACAYGSQIGFQFGGPAATAAALRAFALAEGRGVAAERVLGSVPL